MQIAYFVLIDESVLVHIEGEKTIFVHVTLLKHAVGRDRSDELGERQGLVVPTVAQPEYPVRELVRRYPTKLVELFHGKRRSRVFVLVLAENPPKLTLFRIGQAEQLFELVHPLVIVGRDRLFKERHRRCI